MSHLFTGQELDGETGLYNYNARLYDAELGRFVSADTIVPDPSNPQSLNRYSYVVNSPLKYIDPTGHDYSMNFYLYQYVYDWWGGFWDSYENGNWGNGPGYSTISGFYGSGYSIQNYMAGIYISKYRDYARATGGNGISNYRYMGYANEYTAPIGRTSIGWDDEMDTARYYTNVLHKVLTNGLTLQLSYSHSLLFSGETLSGGIEQPTKSFDLIGNSIDVYFGAETTPREETHEVSLGLGKHAGIGYVSGRPGKDGKDELLGMALHIGVGFAPPINFASTFPTNRALRPSFPDKTELWRRR